MENIRDAAKGHPVKRTGEQQLAPGSRRARTSAVLLKTKFVELSLQVQSALFGEFCTTHKVPMPGFGARSFGFESLQNLEFSQVERAGGTAVDRRDSGNGTLVGREGNEGLKVLLRDVDSGREGARCFQPSLLRDARLAGLGASR
jgi:hypothetical protein